LLDESKRVRSDSRLLAEPCVCVSRIESLIEFFEGRLLKDPHACRGRDNEFSPVPRACVVVAAFAQRESARAALLNPSAS